MPPRSFNKSRARLRWVRLAEAARLRGAVMLVALAPGPAVVEANGVLRDGAGARSMASGGAGAALTGDPLAALYANPAGLAAPNGGWFQLGAVAASAQGEFSNAANPGRPLRSEWGALPEAALALPLKGTPVTLGLAVMPEALASVDWRFTDAPGGLGGATSYGVQRHHAEIIAIRTALGASVRLCDAVTFGGSLGVEYNRNTLVAPYTFQSHPVLRGFKTLLDLETDGWGVNGSIGIVWHPCEQIHVGLSYRSMTHLETDGDADGNASVQLQNIGAGAFQPDFHYDAEVITKLPQIVSAGISWQARERWRLLGQVDWINWSDSFDELDIRLSNGNNADLNGFLGTDAIRDVAPLDWKDRFVIRGGVEFAATAEFTLRAGYAYGGNPVPDSTVTPMSAAILEHTVTAGVGWQRGQWAIGAAYQYSFPSETNVGTSGLESGEYSNSRAEVQAHWLGLTLSIGF